MCVVNFEDCSFRHHTKYISGCDTSKRKDTYRFLNDCKMTIVVRSDLGMGKGKIASQCCHAAVACTRRASRICPDALRSWERSGQPKIILKCLTEQELLQLERDAIVAKIPCYLVFDAGRTQIASGTPTALGVGPASSSLIDQITGKLKLLQSSFPFRVLHRSSGICLQWLVVGGSENKEPLKEHIDSFDIHHYLPPLFEGLCDCNRLYGQVAMIAINDILSFATDRIDINLLRRIMLTIRKALFVGNLDVTMRTLIVLANLIGSANEPRIGKCILPFIPVVIAPLSFYAGAQYGSTCTAIDQLKGTTIHSANDLKSSVKYVFKLIEEVCGIDGFMLIKSYYPQYHSQVGIDTIHLSRKNYMPI
ncbi:hypothetical protein GJ496_009129 [Pomphorhynchus laevis]|nr:hypothetical protein GJ496_009129 [Pomphorhynchus laevis]